MKRIVVLCLSIVIVLAAFVGCDWEENNENLSNNKENSDKPQTQEELIDIIDRLAYARPTLDEFKQMYPDYRIVDESIDGSYSYIHISTPEMPEVVFGFERYFGKNFYSQIYLTTITAGADLLLPEYLGMSIEDILGKEGESAFYKSVSEHVSYGDVYIFRESFCYHIQGYVHPNKLYENGIHIKLYNDSFFSQIEEKPLGIEKNAESLSETLKSLTESRCTLEQFKTIFNDWSVLYKKENSIVITSDSLPGIQLEFITIVDNLKNQKTVLSCITASAQLLMPEYIGMDRYEMREAGLEMPRNKEFDYHILFLYEENYCLCTNPDTERLENDSAVYIIPYTDSWIRPW